MIVVNNYAVESWSPALLSPYLWLDASQETSFADGDPVGTWTNVGSGAGNATATGTARPTYKTGIIGGRPVLRFDSNDAMSIASFDPSSPTPGQMTVWAVMTAPSGADRVVVELSGDFNYANAWILYREATNTVVFGTHGDGTGGIQYSRWGTSGSVTTTPAAFIGTCDRSLSTNEVTGYLSSTTASGTRLSNYNISGDMATNTLYIGARGAASFFFGGDIAEIGVVKSAEASNVTALMNYLAAKYSITLS